MRLALPAFAGLSAPVKGALLMTGAAVAFSGMIGLLRLATDALHPFEVAFFRNLFGLVFMLPWLMRTRFQGLHTERLGLHGLRALTGLAAMLMWFMALSLMPLGEAVALSFTTPLFVTIGAALALGEVIRARRISATLAGFAGMLIIVRPGVEAVQPAAMLVIVSAVFAACSALIVKSLSRTDHGNSIVTWMVVFLTPMSLVPALFVWQWPSLETVAVLFAMAGLATLGHIAFTRAMTRADISAVLPFEYLRLPMVALIGYLAFGEVMDPWAWAGAALIIASTLYIARREAVVARERRPHDPGPISAGSAKEKL